MGGARGGGVDPTNQIASLCFAFCLQPLKKKSVFVLFFENPFAVLFELLLRVSKNLK